MYKNGMNYKVPIKIQMSKSMMSNTMVIPKSLINLLKLNYKSNYNEYNLIYEICIIIYDQQILINK